MDKKHQRSQDKDSARVAHKRTQSRKSSQKHRLRQQLMMEEAMKKEEYLTQNVKDLKTENREIRERIALLKQYGYGKKPPGASSGVVASASPISTSSAIAASTSVSRCPPSNVSAATTPPRSHDRNQARFFANDIASISVGSTINSAGTINSASTIASIPRGGYEVVAQAESPRQSERSGTALDHAALFQVAAKIKLQHQVDELAKEQKRLMAARQAEQEKAQKQAILLQVLQRLAHTEGLTNAAPQGPGRLEDLLRQALATTSVPSASTSAASGRPQLEDGENWLISQLAMELLRNDQGSLPRLAPTPISSNASINNDALELLLAQRLQGLIRNNLW